MFRAACLVPRWPIGALPCGYEAGWRARWLSTPPTPPPTPSVDAHANFTQEPEAAAQEVPRRSISELPVSFADICRAHARIKSGIRFTSCYRSTPLSRLCEANVYLKVRSAVTPYVAWSPCSRGRIRVVCEWLLYLGVCFDSSYCPLCRINRRNDNECALSAENRSLMQSICKASNMPLTPIGMLRRPSCSSRLGRSRSAGPATLCSISQPSKKREV